MNDRSKHGMSRKITTLVFVAYCAFAIGITSTINKRLKRR